MKVQLRTVAVRNDGCFSVLLIEGQPFAVTCERTFEDGLPVIKAGEHRCKRDFYNKGGYETFEIEVEGHDRVLFHKGNKETDSKACILVGESFTVMDGVTAIAQSGDGFKEFMARLEDVEEFTLEVHDDELASRL